MMDLSFSDVWTRFKNVIEGMNIVYTVSSSFRFILNQ